MRFRGLLATLVLLVTLVLVQPAAATRGGAWIVDAARLTDRLVELTVHSPAVGGNVGVRVLLPRDWERSPRRGWPTLYLLHGCCDGDNGFRSWTNNTDVEELTADRNLLVVMPEAGPAGFYSDWRSGPAWETFHLIELRGLVEREFRAGGARAVAGLSMGGFGALSYAARHPGHFDAAASYSGVVHPTYRGTVSTSLVRSLVSRAGLDPDDLWGDPVADARIWAAHNPFDLAERLRGTPVHLSAGTGEPGPLDPPGAAPDELERLLGEQSVALAARLRAEHVPVRTDFYGPGRHTWPYWERALHRSFPMLERAMCGRRC